MKGGVGLVITLVAALLGGPSGLAAAMSLRELAPGGVGTALEAALRAARLDEAKLEAGGVTFVSGESYSQAGEHVVNRVSFVPGERFDLWWMKQRVAKEGARASLLLVAVDKQTRPKTASYFEFDGERPLEAGVVPQPRPFSAACFTCHASGPRAIRPHASRPLAAEAWAKVRAWNETIAAYRVVATHKPRPKTRAFPVIAFGGEAENAPVTHPACVQCHASESGVRAGLLRQHRTTIEAMIANGADAHGYYVAAGERAFMPMEGQALDADEKTCLVHWLEHPEESPKAGCDARGARLRGAESEWRVDPVGSRVEAEVASTVGDFAVRGADLAGALRCVRRQSAMKCSGEIRADLRRVVTGIELRDRHLRERYLRTGEHPFVVLSMEGVAIPETTGMHELPVTVELAGKKADYVATLACEAKETLRCRISRLVLSLARHGVEVPAFLGASVRDEVGLAGVVRWVEKSGE